MTRKPISPKDMKSIFAQSRRRCCICYGLKRDGEIKNGQIAHLDRDSSNSQIENLAFLCLEHHDMYDSRTSQSKNLTIDEVKQYREELYSAVAQQFSISPDLVVNQHVVPDKYCGTFFTNFPNMEVTVSISRVGSEYYLVEGLSLWGTTREFGPNIGELCAVATLNGEMLYYEEKEVGYSFTIEFGNDEILLIENNAHVKFGMNAYFEGIHPRRK